MLEVTDYDIELPKKHSSSAYDTLPFLLAAASLFKEKDTKKKLFGPIQKLFLDRKMNKKYGISLLHRHFPMEPNERLVEYLHVSVPWRFADDDGNITVNKHKGFVVPHSYRFVGKSLEAYEFVYRGAEISDYGEKLFSNDEMVFFRDLASLLREHELDTILGIRVLQAGHDYSYNVEVTEGRANIMLAESPDPGKELIEAFWVFDDGNMTDYCDCGYCQHCSHCYGCCRAYCIIDTDGDHMRRH